DDAAEVAASLFRRYANLVVARRQSADRTVRALCRRCRPDELRGAKAGAHRCSARFKLQTELRIRRNRGDGADRSLPNKGGGYPRGGTTKRIRLRRVWSVSWEASSYTLPV